MTRHAPFILLLVATACATMPPPGRMEALPAVAAQTTEHSVEGAFTLGLPPMGGVSYAYAPTKHPLAFDVHGQGAARSVNGGVGVWVRSFPDDAGFSFGARFGGVVGGGAVLEAPRFEPVFYGGNVALQVAQAPPNWGGSWSTSLRFEYTRPTVELYRDQTEVTINGEPTLADVAVLPGIWTTLDTRANIPLGKDGPVRLAAGLGAHLFIYVPFPFVTVGLQGNFGRQIGRPE